MSRIERAFGIMLLLSDGSTRTATALAQRFEVTVRTIYRDIDMLSAAGVPVYAERGAAGGYRLLDGYFLPPVALGRDEVVAVLLGFALLRGLKVMPFAAALESAEKKLLAVLPARLRPLLGETHRLIGFEAAAADAFHPELPQEAEAEPRDEALAVETFLRGVLDGTRVRLTYRSPYHPSRRGGDPIETEPLGLFWDRERWYLIGRVLDAGGKAAAQRYWRADRIGTIERSTFRISGSSGFDVRRHLGRAWLRGAMTEWARSSPVRIRMRPEQAARLAADWYFAYAAFAPDESGEVVMTYGENDRAKVFELVRWLGPGAELLEPAPWRSELAAELNALAALYR